MISGPAILLGGPAALAVIVWLYLLLGHGRFWRADQRLGAAPAATEIDWPGVVAVVPARNEAAVIGQSLASLLASHYPGPFDVIVVDDGSDDGTGDIIRQFAAGAGDRRVTLVATPALPEGWTGKLWAVHQGLNRVGQVAPQARYVLLSDADIVHGPDTLAALVAKAEREGRVLVSLLARLDDRGFWAGLLIPAFVFFFQKLYPFPRVNDSRRQTAAAAGGCMLVERTALDAAGGVAAIRDRLIDDCALARLIKGRPPHRPIWLGLGREVISLRDNGRLQDVWDMVARTAYAQLHFSPWLLLGTAAGMSFLYLLGPLLVLTWPIHREPLAGVLGLATWALMTVAYAPTLRLYGRAWWSGLGLPLAALGYTLMTVDSARRHWQERGGRWKGRSYSRPPADQG